eukprot:gene8854-6374_t
MDIGAPEAATIAPTAASSLRLFERYNDVTVVEGVAAMVRATNDDDIAETFNEIQEGLADRKSLRWCLLELLHLDETEDQTVKNINLLEQYFGWNWNMITAETDILELFPSEPELLSFLIAKLATVRLAHLGTTLEEAHALFDDKVQQLVATVDNRVPTFLSDSLACPYLTPSPALDVVQLLEDTCRSYALVQRQYGVRIQHFYSRYFAMIQSSGVGKTRAVLELMQHSQRVFVVYINLRPADISGDPCRTPVIADLIDRCVRSATDWQMLIVAVQMTLKGLVDAHLLPNEAEARMAFYTQQQDATRQTFWSQVRHTFTVMRRVVGTGHAAAREWDQRQCTIIGHTFRLANAEGQPMVLVLALDDCWHSLQTDGKLVTLQGALDYTKRTLTDVVAILMDTDASVGQFAPLELPYSASSRVISGHLLNTPFFLFPIDLSSELGQRWGPDTWPPEAEYRATVTLTEGSTSYSSSTSSSTVCAASPEAAAAAAAAVVDIVVRYNPVEEVLCCRPLFATGFTNAIDTALSHRSDSDNSDTWLASVVEAAFAACMDTVARKLDAVPGDAPPASAAEAERIRLFSYTAIRWRATTTSRVLMEGLLRQQLGLLREVGPGMETLLCAYGLEPLLGRHVASQMTATASAAAVFEDILRTLHDLKGQGQLCGYQSRGDHAALVATIVLSRAHDTATVRSVPSAQPSTIQNVGPVLLRDWLAQLLDDGASLWAKLQAQAGSALDRAVVFFHSVYQVETDATPPITVEMARWYLQRGTAMVAPRGKAKAAADLFVPFAVPHGDDSSSSSAEIDLMDPDTYVLGVLPVQVTSVNAGHDGVDDNAALLRGLLGSEVLQQFPLDAPRVGLVIHMKPGGQAASATASTAWATDAKEDAFVVLARAQKKSTRPAGRAAETPTFAPCGFVKYFWNRIPCVVQQPGADDNGEAAWRLLWSMAQFDSFAHLTTSTLQQYSRTADGYARSEAQLQRTVRALGQEMFHIHRPYGDQDTTAAPTAKPAAVAADDATVPMEAADGRTRSRKGGAAEPYRAVKRTRLEETQDAGNAEGHRPEP